MTRQVYLHRSGYAGGLTTLAWDQVSPEPALGVPEWRGTGRQLMLAWTNDMTGLPYFHIMLVGKVADGTGDIVNLWEFIPIAEHGDTLACPIHGPVAIQASGSGMQANGKTPARDGDTASCGATLIASQKGINWKG